MVHRISGQRQTVFEVYGNEYQIVYALADFQVIIEAARQTFLAVTEEFFIGFNNHQQYYFVINSMDTKFKAFLFPIDVSIKYEITEKEIDDPNRMKIGASISFIQNFDCAAQVIVTFTVYQHQKIVQRENLLAQEAIAKQQISATDTGNDKSAANAA